MAYLRLVRSRTRSYERRWQPIFDGMGSLLVYRDLDRLLRHRFFALSLGCSVAQRNLSDGRSWGVAGPGLARLFHLSRCLAISPSPLDLLVRWSVLPGLCRRILFHMVVASDRG